jgi:outer membrane murein-binding lipoprotein Lpp
MPRPPAARAPPEESVATLASAIAALDARREANDPSLSTADYDAERAALKARLAAKLADGASPA